MAAICIISGLICLSEECFTFQDGIVFVIYVTSIHPIRLRWSINGKYLRAILPRKSNFLRNSFRTDDQSSLLCPKNVLFQFLLNPFMPTFPCYFLAPCPPPVAPVNGFVFGDNHQHHSSVQFFCKKGFTLRGSASSQCFDGKWDSSIPHCEGKITSICFYSILVYYCLG